MTTTGAQTFNDAVSLTAATALTSSGGAAISLNSTVNGAFTLAVNTTGATTFAGVVGPTVVSVTTDVGGTTSIGADLTTTGAQTFNDAVSLTASVTLTASTVTFFSLAGAGNSLTLTCSAAVTVDGAIYLGILNLLSNGVGTTNLTGVISTNGTQTYSNAVGADGQHDAYEHGQPRHLPELHGERCLHPRGEHHRGHDLRGRGGSDGGERDDRRRGYDEHRRERDHHGSPDLQRRGEPDGGNGAYELGGRRHLPELHGERCLHPRGEHHRGYDLRGRGGSDGGERDDQRRGYDEHRRERDHHGSPDLQRRGEPDGGNTILASSGGAAISLNSTVDGAFTLAVNTPEPRPSPA